MDDLSVEYEGRARVARFMVMEADGSIPAPDIVDRYMIYGVPMVILFNRGKEVRRWWLTYAAGMYRYELDKLVGKQPQWRDWWSTW
jgi:hypothetical protein